jgi:hypothetical protein
MAYFPTENRLGLSPFTQIDTAEAYALGTIVSGQDTPSSGGGLGAGEFIYLAGVASTVVGSTVVYNPNTGTTTLVPNTANTAAPLAVAMSANNLATTFGWYQITGVTVMKKTAVKVSPNVAIFVSATAGRISSVAASGKQVVPARSVNSATVASATSTVLVLLQRSHVQDQTI